MSDPRKPTMKRAIPILLAAACLLVGGGAMLALARGGGPGGGFHGTEWDPPEAAADFRLVDQAGRPASIRDYRGEAVLLFFGYTSCPDVCPLTLARLQRVLAGMGDDAEEVRVLLVTVDPERDTPEALARYVARYGPRVVGLTGDPDELARVRKAYYVYAEPVVAPPPGSAEHAMHAARPVGDLTHTPQVLGIDREGRIRVLLPMDRSDDEIADDVRALLRG